MQQQRAVPSPCISVCALDDNHICIGCFRSADEISNWRVLGDDKKRQVYRNIEARIAEAGAWLTGGQQ